MCTWWKQKFRYRAHNSPQCVHVLSQTITVQAIRLILKLPSHLHNCSQIYSRAMELFSREIIPANCQVQIACRISSVSFWRWHCEINFELRLSLDVKAATQLQIQVQLQIQIHGYSCSYRYRYSCRYSYRYRYSATDRLQIQIQLLL